jgi:DNA-binding response OmpR family regulator
MLEQQIGGKPRIYIVDDDSHFLTALRRFLAIEGYDVAAFDSPAAFLAAHDPGQPGCLLLDLKMAEMSGLDVQSRLIADGQTRPVIFITGEASVPTSVTAMKQGARDYLTKPVAPEVLLTAIREAVAEDARLRSGAQPVESWETAVTEGGDIAVSFMAARGQAGELRCDREAAMEIAKDLLRTVALSDVQPDIQIRSLGLVANDTARRRPDMSVFAIREPDPADGAIT